MKIEEKKIITVEGKEVLRITTTDERWYKVGEEYWPSVTWIGSYYPKSIRYIKWVADQGFKEAEIVRMEAAEKGSREHNACVAALRGEKINYDSKFPANDGEEPKELTPMEYAGVISFVEFLDRYQPKVLGLDYTVTNPQHKFAGTVDFKCRLNIDDYKGVWIVDIKTSKDIWPNHELQVSAYKSCDSKVTNIAILQIGYERNKTQKYKFTPIDDQFSLFLDVKNIWAKETAGIVPLQKDYPLSVKWIPIVGKSPVPATKTKVAKKKIAVKRKVK